MRISERAGHVLRILTIVAFLACGVMAWRILDRPDPIEDVATDGDAYDVREAIAVSRAEPMTIRGYVFEGPGAFELRLCDSRIPGRPPKCIGPFVALEQVDRGSFELREGKLDGRTMYYSPEPVAMTGILVGSIFTVQVVVG